MIQSFVPEETAMPAFYDSLPEGYAAVRVIDAKDKKTALLFTLFSLILTVLPLLPVLLLADWKALDASRLIAYYLVLLAGLISYIILHELTHGAAYKLLTHRKLTYGFTLTVAFCGVPDIFVSRRTALISLVAPLTLWSLVLLPLTVVFFFLDTGWFLVCGILFAVHFGGCVGDMYDTLLLLFRYRDRRLLMCDTGPKQTFYLPAD